MEGASSSEHPVVVVGGGLAGLACAQTLAVEGVRPLVVEASDRVGGRVRTDEVDGFRLDRGFQVLLDSYPTVRRLLDLEALELRPFLPGARVRKDGRFQDVVDPWRSPGRAMSAAAGPGSLADKLRLARLRTRLLRKDKAALMGGPDRSTREALHELGFSSGMVDTFFRPFFGGVFLDSTLTTTRRMFDFVFRMFAEGRACLPATGMEAVPRQLAARLPPGSVRTGCRVRSVGSDAVVLEGGERIRAEAVVVATDGLEAGRLVGEVDAGAMVRPSFRGVTCLYFAAPDDPVGEPLLVLNGDGEGPVNNLCVPSRVARRYAPDGQALVSVTVLEDRVGGEREGSAPTGRGPTDDAVAGGAVAWGASGPPAPEDAVRRQLRDWFGPAVDGWRHLRTYRIDEALPAQPVGWLDPPRRPVRVAGLYVCGDHRDDASIDGALRSGVRCAEAVLQDRTR